MFEIESENLKNSIFLTKTQQDLLLGHGFATISHLMQHIPDKLSVIYPWTNLKSDLISRSQYKYKAVFQLKGFSYRKSMKGSTYIQLQLEDVQGSSYQGFWFVKSPFILKILKTKSRVLAVVSFFRGQPSKNLIISKLSFIDTNSSLSYIDNVELDIRYAKVGPKLDSAFFKRVHQRLPQSSYLFNLKGLVPPDLLGTLQLDFYSLHHPKSEAEFQNAYSKLQKVKVFFKAALSHYAATISESRRNALKPDFDLVWLQNQLPSLPVELTISQKQAIWEILQDTTLVNSI